MTPMRNLPLALVMAATLVGPAIAQKRALPTIPPNAFVHPDGPFAVGMRELFWIDPKRPEPFTKDPTDHRRLIARLWYPAQEGTGTPHAPYVADMREFGDSSRYKRVAHVKTNAALDAAVAPPPARYPVLVYQPGGGTSRIAGTFECEQFASHGYVVIAVDHPGFDETVRFPDGTAFHADTLQFKPATGTIHDAEANWDYLNKVVFPTWTADASFTLDKLQELERTPGQPFFHRLDLSRIGMFGWSFGGATSLQMSRSDPRVKAAVDQDGQLFGDVRDRGTGRPVMILQHGNSDIPKASPDSVFFKSLLDKVEGWNRSFIAHSTNDWYDLRIARISHGHFSDLSLFYPRDTADLDPRRAHQIVVAYTLAFFDRYLNGRPSPLLAGPSSAYPEVTFKKK